MFFIDWNNQGISFANLLKCFFSFLPLYQFLLGPVEFSFISMELYITSSTSIYIISLIWKMRKLFGSCPVNCNIFKDMWNSASIVNCRQSQLLGFFFFFTVEQNITSSSKIWNTINFTMKNRTRKIISWKLLFLYQSFLKEIYIYQCKISSINHKNTCNFQH